MTTRAMATPATTAKRLLLALGLGGIGVVNTPAAPDEAPLLMSTERVDARPAWSTVEELIKAADAGHALASYQYAQLLEFGDQVSADKTKAASYYRLAAKGGDANAAFRLGKAYHDGDLGLARDYERSREYYRAAAADVPEASFNLGAAYVSGRGVRRDYVEGLAWLLVAADRGAGGDAAQQVRKRIAKYPERIAAAEKRAEVLRKELSEGSAAISAATGGLEAFAPQTSAPVARPRAPVAAPPSTVPRPTFSLPSSTFALPAPPPPVPPAAEPKAEAP